MGLISKKIKVFNKAKLFYEAKQNMCVDFHLIFTINDWHDQGPRYAERYYV